MRRYIDHAELLEHAARVLEKIVLPEVMGAGARGQLWAAIGILNNVASRMEPISESQLERHHALLRALPIELRVGQESYGDSSEVSETDALLLALASPKLSDASLAWLKKCRDYLTEEERADKLQMRPTNFFKAVAG
jgi:hypothetical protein